MRERIFNPAGHSMKPSFEQSIRTLFVSTESLFRGIQSDLASANARTRGTNEQEQAIRRRFRGGSIWSSFREAARCPSI